MCGIVGYLGPRNPKDVIVAGLKKLEYRGYDSAGVAILHEGRTKRVRASGKLRALEERLASEAFDGHAGIGHTRWATHGAPSERNAHPHQVGGVSIVHNGIIENYLEIRSELQGRGAVIASDTDSELVAHLLAEEVEKTRDLLTAVQKVLPRLQGAFSIVAMWDEDPGRLVAFKDGPPLVIGLGSDESFVVSDVQAALAYTKRFIYLEDREIVSARGGAIQVVDVQGRALNKTPVDVEWGPEMVEKQGYPHFMLKEIYEQPRAVAAAMAPHVDPATFTVRLSGVRFGDAVEAARRSEDEDRQRTVEVLRGVERVFVVACGTSYYAAMVAKYLIERIAQVPVETDIASEFRYRQPVLPAGCLVLTISQSGETADTLAAIRLAKEKGALTLSLCNVRGSSIDREAHGHLSMNAGPEIGVASTKAFMATLTVLNCLAVALARAKDRLTLAEENDLVRSLVAVPSQLEGVLAYDKYFDAAAERLKDYHGFLYMGRGVSFPIALEGALKLKELAYLHAEGYAAGEMKHGPLALIDDNMAIVMIVPADELFEKTLSNMEEARARGGKILCLSTGDNERLRKISEYYLSLPKASWTVSPLLSVVPLQLMAYHLASRLGYDVDQPRNLAKSVTVE